MLPPRVASACLGLPPPASADSLTATSARAPPSQWPALREDEADRLSNFLEQLATQYVGTDDYSGEGKSNGVKVGRPPPSIRTRQRHEDEHATSIDTHRAHD